MKERLESRGNTRVGKSEKKMTRERGKKEWKKRYIKRRERGEGEYFLLISSSLGEGRRWKAVDKRQI